MRRTGLIIVLLLVVVSIQVPVRAEVVIFRVRDLTLVANEVYHTTISVEPHAPYRIVSDISPSMAETAEELVTMQLHSEWALGGVSIIHRSDNGHMNVTWTPMVAEYELNITNWGHLEEVSVNLTITQTGAPTISVVPYDDLVSRAFVPLALIMVVPPALFAVTFVLYKKYRIRSLE